MCSWPGMVEQLMYMLAPPAPTPSPPGHPEIAAALIWSLLRCGSLEFQRALSAGAVVQSCIHLATDTARSSERLRVCCTVRPLLPSSNARTTLAVT